MSTTSSPSGERVAVAPANVSAASSSPPRIAPSIPVRAVQLGREVRAVGGVAGGRGQHGDRALGALLRDHARVALDDAEHALARVGPQPAAGLQAVAEAGDERFADDLAQRAARVDVRHEQPRRVGSHVDNGGPHSGA